MQVDETKLNRVDTFFDDCPILDDITKIQEFAFAVTHTRVSALSKPELQIAIADHISQDLSKFLTEKKLYHHDELSSAPEDHQIDVTYGDDLYHCQASLNDHVFAFRRNPSSMREFITFYRVFAPYCAELYKSTVAMIEGGTPFKISPFSCAFRFKIDLSGFEPAGKTRKSRLYNYELMERLLPMLPPNKGPFAEMNCDQISRSDIKVGVWKLFGENLRNCWFEVQAPANKSWSRLELTFTYQGGTHTGRNGERRPFDPLTLNEWDVALLDFFKGLALNKFLMSWLKDVNFESA